MCSEQGTCCIIRACTELIRSEPNNVVAYNHRGNALRSTGQLTLAIEDHSKAIEIDATNAVEWHRGLKYTIKDGVIYDTAELLADVRELVKESFAEDVPARFAAQQPKAAE